MKRASKPCGLAAIFAGAQKIHFIGCARLIPGYVTTGRTSRVDEFQLTVNCGRRLSLVNRINLSLSDDGLPTTIGLQCLGNKYAELKRDDSIPARLASILCVPRFEPALSWRRLD